MMSSVARIGREIILEPQRALEIEIVGRLVEQQEVGLGEQSRGERDAHAPAAGKGGQRPRAARFVETKAGKDRRRARRRRMRVDIDKPRMDFGDAMRIGGGLGFAKQRAALGIGREHEIDERRLAAGRFLRDLADPRAPGQRDRAALGRDLAGDQPEQRRLADAVAPDEADARRRQGSTGRAVEKKARPKPVGEVVDLQHRAAHAVPRRACPAPACRTRKATAISAPLLNSDDKDRPRHGDRTHFLDPQAGRDAPQSHRQDQRQDRGSGTAHRRAEARPDDARAGRDFYAVHKERPFFGELVEQMTGGPVVVQVLEGENAIAKISRSDGRDQPGQGRSPARSARICAKSMGENSVHGSDAPETAEIEIAQWFAGNEIVG